MVDSNGMSRLGAWRLGAISAGRRKTSRSLRCAFVILAVFVSATTTMAVTDGVSAAVTIGLVIIAVVGTAVGVWGTAMAVKETHELESRVEDLRETQPLVRSSS
jgi:hypothetical protein